MEKLLKDLPEFAERIENNYFLLNEIQDELTTNAEFAYLISENESHASGDTANNIFIEDAHILAESILKIIADFVNQNYTPKK